MKTKGVGETIEKKGGLRVNNFKKLGEKNYQICLIYTPALLPRFFTLGLVLTILIF